MRAAHNKKNIQLGTIFGDLTVLYENGRSPRGDVMWHCKCICGGVVDVRGFELRNHNVTRCGKCPPTNQYRFADNAVFGSVNGDKEFMIDQEYYDLASKYQWLTMSKGYIATIVGRKTILLHSLVMNSIGKSEVDHVDGNVLNNRKDNLRICSHQQNMCNKKRHANNTSGYKGVHLRSDHKAYVASIKVNGIAHYLGSFSSPISAAQAYDNAARSMHGEYARLNFNNGLGTAQSIASY